MSPQAAPLAELIASRRVVVLCGAGGVGKTTTAAALGLAAAAAGRRTLVLTIDPARRLAQAMGVEAGRPDPTTVDPARLADAGLTTTAPLDAWMLDPASVLTGLVQRHAPPEQGRALQRNTLFRRLEQLVAGMQEYTAGEALHHALESGRYDVVILDTPPSRHALDFLDAPGRLLRFLDEGLLRHLLPAAEPHRAGAVLARHAGRLASGLLSRLLGPAFVTELQELLAALAVLFGPMRRHADALANVLASDAAAFVVVTAPAAGPLAEAQYFRGELVRRALPFAGMVLNRSLAAGGDGSTTPDAPPSPALNAALEKLAPLLRDDATRARADARLLEQLQQDCAPGWAIAAPDLPAAAQGLEGLARLATTLCPRSAAVDVAPTQLD